MIHTFHLLRTLLRTLFLITNLEKQRDLKIGIKIFVRQFTSTTINLYFIDATQKSQNN